MRVLWLTNSLLPDHARAVGKTYSHRGCWMSAMAEAMVADGRVKLAVATNLSVVRATRRSVRDIMYYTVPVRSGNRTRRRLPVALVQAYQRVIQDFEPEVVHVHGTEYYHGLLTTTCQINCPVVISIQGIIDVCRHHWYGGLSPEVISAKRTLRDWVRRDGLKEQKRKLTARSALEREIFANNSCFVGRTQWDRAHLCRLNPAATYYHCDELLRVPFYHARWQLDKMRRFTMFVSGANYPLKGFHVLLKAVALLRDEFPRVRVRVLGAQCYPGTSGPKRIWKNCRSRGYARYLSDLICEKGLTACIDMLPSLNAQGVVNELKRAHVFVLPSLIENSSNSLAEAMIVGTPVVASCVGGIPSLASPGKSALMFPSSDEAALAEQIGLLFRDDELAVRLSGEATAVATTRHSHARNVDTMVQIYQAVAGKKTVSRQMPPRLEAVAP